MRQNHEFEAGSGGGDAKYCQCPGSWMSEVKEEFWSKLDGVVQCAPDGETGDWSRLQ